MIKLNVQFNQPIQPFGAKAVQAVVGALDKELKPDEITMNVVVTDAKTVQELNQKYAGKNQATDVLSFNYQEGTPAAQERAGDIVVSYEHVKNQAEEAQTDENTELALLILHGGLHVLGYDHQNIKAREQLDKLQAKIMRKAGLSYRNFGWTSS